MPKKARCRQTTRTPKDSVSREARALADRIGLLKSA